MNLNKKSIIVGIIIMIIPAIIVFFMMNMSKDKKEKLIVKTKDYLICLDKIDSEDYSNEVVKYISYSVCYANNIDGVSKITSNDVNNLTSRIFDKNIDIDEIKNNTSSYLMIDEGIDYDSTNDLFSIDEDQSSQYNISKKPIIMYKIKSIRRFNNDYSVKYQKYIIEDPYTILNYYIDGNHNNVDIIKIQDYLKGAGKIVDIKKVVNDDILQNYAKKDGTIRVNYSCNSDTCVIKKTKV